VKRSVALAALVGVLVLVVLACRWPWARPATLNAYIVHHAQGAFKTLADDFERETGIHVEASYLCRAALPDAVTKDCGADFYVNCDPNALAKVAREGLTSGSPVPVAELVPVIVVPRGNPKGIATVADLARPGVRLCLGLEKGCMGPIWKEILEKAGVAAQAAPNIVARTCGEMNLVTSVDGQKIDATIIWVSSVRDVGREDVDVVPIPPDGNVIEPLSALVLTVGRNRPAAERFIAFLQTPKAQRIFAEAGHRRF
jgi:molybdate transport system substrate-binding protein